MTKKKGELNMGTDLKKLTLNLPSSLHKDLKRYALEKDTTMTELVLMWIQEQLRPEKETQAMKESLAERKNLPFHGKKK